MNLFGCKFCMKHTDGTRSCERKNFDSLLWAIITVFQVSILNSNYYNNRLTHFILLLIDVFQKLMRQINY